MADTPTSPLTGNVLFYKQPEPLTPENHGALGIKQIEHPFAFAAMSHVIPLTVGEFQPCALSYPIIFVGNETKSPLAVMGLRQGENLYMENGDFRPDTYVPLFVRRYPFIFANEPDSDRLVLCFDRAAPMITDKPDTPFFVDGKASPFVEQCMQFCQNFETERLRTTAFMKLLEDNDLLEQRESNFTPRNPDGSNGAPQKIADYWAVTDEKLNKLSAKKLVELRDNGALSQIYAHQASLLGWDRLIAVAMTRAARQQPANA